MQFNDLVVAFELQTKEKKLDVLGGCSVALTTLQTVEVALLFLWSLVSCFRAFIGVNLLPLCLEFEEDSEFLF